MSTESAEKLTHSFRAIDQALTKTDTTHVNLRHLRRFAKPQNLPSCLKDRLLRTQSRVEAQPKHKSSTKESGRDDANAAEQDGVLYSLLEGPTLYLLIGPASLATGQDILDIVTTAYSTAELSSIPIIYNIPVPATAPNSAAEAQEWSKAYWPTSYKKHNPNGPQPSIVSQAEERMQPFVGTWMALARRVAVEAHDKAFGERFGAVVVDSHVLTDSPAVIAVAGDARWKDTSSPERHGGGNVLAHAVMRVIALVARKRQRLAQEVGAATDDSNIFQDYPLTATEQTFFDANTLEAGGYLCTGFDIYLTHEPCLMCSMAILHSRFKKVVFNRRMSGTGGLTAESSEEGSSEQGLGYGLFWLPKLNWKLLAWEWIDEGADLTSWKGDDSQMRAVHS